MKTPYSPPDAMPKINDENATPLERSRNSGQAQNAACVIHVILPALGRMSICIRVADVKLCVFDDCLLTLSCQLLVG